ncbi:MAG TPA: hypothetical protein VKY39_05740 [Aggregatilineales bacterium]|nr:hypothetical protein [Aggregatilineales bacterium]
MLKRNTTGLPRRAALVLAVLLLAGCTQEWRFGERRVDFEGSAEPGHAAATYRLFTGEEAWTETLQPGDTFVVEYDVAIKEGVLSIAVTGPSGADVWRVNLGEDTASSESFEAEATGDYRLSVRGLNAVGGYDVSWQVSPAVEG